MFFKSVFGNFRLRIVTTIIALAVVTIISVKVHLAMNPLGQMVDNKPGGTIFDSQTNAGKAFMSASECAHRQKGLYGYIEAYKEKHGKIPSDLSALVNDDVRSMHFTSCPLGAPYVLYTENYGKPNMLFISDSKHKHPTAFQLWARGIKPLVQTMGDGTIHMFENGKIATIKAIED
jgi:hypothetical protein